MTGVFIKRGNLNTATCTRRMPHKYEHRDWGDVSKSQGAAKTASTPPETGRGVEQMLSQSSEGINPAKTLTSDC